MITFSKKFAELLKLSKTKIILEIDQKFDLDIFNKTLIGNLFPL